MGPSNEPSWRRYFTFWRSNVDRDVDAELRFHFEERVADLVARGRTPGAARAEAEEEFGDSRYYRDRLREIGRRMDDRRQRHAWLEATATDLRYALRGVRRSPGLAITIMVILALGIGANATMFGLIDRLLFRAPPHIADPGRVVLVQIGKLAETWRQTTLTYGHKGVFETVSDFSGVALATPTAVVRRQYYSVGRGLSSSSAAGALATNNYFSVLGVRPEIGRLFSPAADTATIPERVAVLGYGYWQRQYGGRRDVLGQRLEVGTETFTIVGVLPAGFTGTELRDVDIWLPLNAALGLHLTRNNPQWRTNQDQWLLVIARVRAGVDLRHAEAQATIAFRNWSRSMLKAPTAKRLASIDSQQVRFSSMIPGRSTWSWGLSGSGSDVKITLLLAGASVMLILIACANVTNLLLVRSLARRREIAVRLSLGVSRARLIGQLLIEGSVLTVGGIVGAVVTSAVASGFIRRWLIGEGAFSDTVVDGRVLAFTCLAGLTTGIVASLLPALQASRADLAVALKSGSRLDMQRGTRLRDGLLVAQGAIAIVLLAGATVFLRSLRNANAVDVGLDAGQVVMARIDQGVTGLSASETRSLFDEFARRTRGLPGIRAVALASPVPFAGSWQTQAFIPGLTEASRGREVVQYFVTPGYFEVLGIRTLLGRTLRDDDRPGAAIVVSEATARRFWPRENAIGRCMKFGADTAPCATIVGVVANTRRQDLLEDQPALQVYRPLPVPGEPGAADASSPTYTLIARADGDAARQIEPIRRTLASTAPSVPYPAVQTIRQRMEPQWRNWQLGSRVFGAFAIVAVVLAAVGLFSVVAFTVGQRMYEFGVRKALGARPSHIARLALARGIGPALGGIALGVVLVLAMGRFLEGVLFQESTRDPIAFAWPAAVLLASAGLASLLPAMRASRADPRTALTAD